MKILYNGDLLCVPKDIDFAEMLLKSMLNEMVNNDYIGVKSKVERGTVVKVEGYDIALDESVVYELVI